MALTVKEIRESSDYDSYIIQMSIKQKDAPPIIKPYMQVAGLIAQFHDWCESNEYRPIIGEPETRRCSNGVDGEVWTTIKVMALKRNEDGTDMEMSVGYGSAAGVYGTVGANEFSAIENVETSALGRALRSMGFGTGSASAEEMEKIGTAADNALLNAMMGIDAPASDDVPEEKKPKVKNKSGAKKITPAAPVEPDSAVDVVVETASVVVSNVIEAPVIAPAISDSKPVVAEPKPVAAEPVVEAEKPVADEVMEPDAATRSILDMMSGRAAPAKIQPAKATTATTEPKKLSLKIGGQPVTFEEVAPQEEKPAKPAEQKPLMYGDLEIDQSTGEVLNADILDGDDNFADAVKLVSSMM